MIISMLIIDPWLFYILCFVNKVFDVNIFLPLDGFPFFCKCFVLFLCIQNSWLNVLLQALAALDKSEQSRKATEDVNKILMKNASELEDTCKTLTTQLEQQYMGHQKTADKLQHMQSMLSDDDQTKVNCEAVAVSWGCWQKPPIGFKNGKFENMGYFNA